MKIIGLVALATTAVMVVGKVIDSVSDSNSVIGTIASRMYDGVKSLASSVWEGAKNIGSSFCGFVGGLFSW